MTDKHQKAVQKVETDQPMMSITFDCAYVDTPTDEILSILDEYGIKCTFFMTGEFLINFPESARKIRDAGHEIGCHSLSHPHLLSYALNMRFKQVRRNVELVRSTLGVTPRLFRPPHGIKHIDQHAEGLHPRGGKRMRLLGMKQGVIQSA